MEDFYYAGGLPVVLNELKTLINLDLKTASGKSHRENIKGAKCYNREVIASIEIPLKQSAGIAVLKGNMAQNGAVIKPSAAKEPRLMQHKGKAVVFENIEDFHARIDDPNLDIDEDSDESTIRNTLLTNFAELQRVGGVNEFLTQHNSEILAQLESLRTSLAQDAGSEDLAEAIRELAQAQGKKKRSLALRAGAEVVKAPIRLAKIRDKCNQKR